METSKSDYLNEKFGLQIAIQEMQYDLDAQFAGIDAVKDLSKTVFGAASLIVGLMSALGLFLQSGKQYTWWYLLGIVLIVFLYISLVILCIKTLTPVTLKRPIPANWKLIYKHYVDKSEIQILRSQLNAYIDVIDENAPVLDSRRRYANKAAIILPIVVILIIIISLLPR